ncbi:DNA alkylation repair protein [Chitinophagaceae bacterium MMS25-I14]
MIYRIYAGMTFEEILTQLQALGQESIKKVLLKHGIKEPLYGVKIEELKKIRKKVKNGHDIALKLYDTGVYDAMYLAGLVTEPEKMSEKELQHWAEKANAPVLRESTVAWVTSESNHGLKKALEWIDSKDEHIASTGWATLSDLVAIKPDSELDISLLKKLLGRIVKSIQGSPERVKYTMNTFVIAVGIYVTELNELAKETARSVGVVTVNMGDTACKVPAALDYIARAEGKGIIGKKRKSARCL